MARAAAGLVQRIIIGGRHFITVVFSTGSVLTVISITVAFLVLVVLCFAGGLALAYVHFLVRVHVHVDLRALAGSFGTQTARRNHRSVTNGFGGGSFTQPNGSLWQLTRGARAFSAEGQTSAAAAAAPRFIVHSSSAGEWGTVG
ncbi:hypothetical protein GN244_ATG18302 [Phytophthora infestans]|uniref:Transmembrane protein n=1 Tax=Phytophthora infestans TaxID=4787 RepID=A0A833RZS2_PHYIN|nr:hypothetical protein GN244_ATG18302 [Phytophthora infestans]